MSRKQAIYCSAAVAALVLIANLLWLGTGSSGLGAAARNTARFSGALFALALLARTPRFPAVFAQRWNLFWAFIAAHGIHFAAVMGVVLFDVASPLHQMTPQVLVTLAGGFGLVLATALTAGDANAPFRSHAHSFFFYFVAASFAIAFGSRVMASPASAAVLALLALALVLRLLPARSGSAASASA